VFVLPLIHIGNWELYTRDAIVPFSYLPTSPPGEEDILVTCVPVELAVEIAQHRLPHDEDLPNSTSLTVQEVVKLLSF